MSNFLQILAEKFTKTPEHSSLLDKLLVCATGMIFNAFLRNELLLPEKLTKTLKHACLLEKLLLSAKWMIFHAFSRNEQLFPSFGRKVDENANTW